jgi:hypothetical protein
MTFESGRFGHAIFSAGLVPEDEKRLPLNGSDKADQYPSSWSNDGKYILYERTTEATGLWIAEMPELSDL